jgi:hypothetical protein
LGGFENSVLRKLFGPEKEKAAAGWRKLHTKYRSGVCVDPMALWSAAARLLRLQFRIPLTASMYVSPLCFLCVT